MKTAISIPDDVFRKAERLAKKLRKSRSELYTEALRRLLVERDTRSLTERIDAALADAGDTGNEAFVRRAARRTLARNEW
jgi:metal-responsive CopG/Arc/MetJ family transcriptional regulator